MRVLEIRKFPLIFFSILIGVLIFSSSFAATPEELRRSIDERASELAELNKQIEETSEKLTDTLNQKKTLSREINSINYDIKQLGLGIKSSEIQIDKLGLELESLAYEIDDIEIAIDVKQEAIGKILRELWEKDREGLLVIFLKNKSLAESVLESEALRDLNQGLSLEVKALESLNVELSDKFASTGKKKSGIELERSNLANRKVIVEDLKKDREVILDRTKNQEKVYQSELTELEEKQLAIGQEIGELEEALRAAFDPSLLPTERPGVLSYPVAEIYVTQNYGKTAFAERAYRTKQHNGVDFRAPIGTPIFASADGIVRSAGNNGNLQYGRYVLIDHNNNLSTLYAHLSRQVVSNGDIVSRGDLVGYSGSTGYSTGAHLHFGLYWTASVELKNFPGAGAVPVGVTINPEGYL